MKEFTSTNANILTVRVETNCPRGGDSGHGGVTIIELIDVASTDMRFEAIKDGVRLRFGGDTECETLIECLKWAAGELERQQTANRLKAR